MRSPSRGDARRRAGYVLLEAIGALVVFSVGIIGVQKALREIVLTRAEARDYTQARFLLDELVSEVTMRPELVEGTFEGVYNGDLSRFHWSYKVVRVELPEAQPIVTYRPGSTRPIVQDPPVKYMGRIEAKVSWMLRGRRYSQTTQTLCQPEKLPEPDTKPDTRAEQANGKPRKPK